MKMFLFSLLALLFLSTNVLAFPACVEPDLKTETGSWYGDYTMPTNFGLTNHDQFTSTLTNKYHHHDYTFNVTIFRDGRVRIEVQSAHGDDRTFKISFRNLDRSHFKSYKVSKGTNCESLHQADMTKVASVSVQEHEN